MHVAFDDEGRFADFAYLYLLGQQAHRAGQRLELSDNSVEVHGSLTSGYAEMAEAQLRDMHELATGADKGNPERHPEDSDVVHEHIDLPDADSDALTDVEAAPKTKRKRRTKAEIAADEAAEVARREAGARMEGQLNDADDSEAATEGVDDEVKDPEPEASEPAEPPKPTGSYPTELLETLKAQAELFEADRTAHLKEGREAIAKHGFADYMATFKGLGLDSAIATYSDDEVKLHRAAIAHLMAP